MKLLHVVGARPNFPKLAPVHRAGATAALEQVIVHTGQHYDEALSDGFFASLGIPTPGHNLAVGSGSHAVQTARIMERIEPVLLAEQPDWVVVYGDVNSTVAAALVAAKLGQRIAHVEAGLRSNDRSMPEEINRIVTDRLADLLLTPSLDANDTLTREGVAPERIAFVGNVMVDSLNYTLASEGLQPGANGTWPDDGSILVTLHRPSNVDDAERLRGIMVALGELAEHRRVVFPAHPRTRSRLAEFGIAAGRVEVGDPVAYEGMLRLMTQAHVVITDSGGVQEETTALGIPCLTLRPNTERPITVTEGTNTLVASPSELPGLVLSSRRGVTHRIPAGWDGRAGQRVIEALVRHLPT
ncbi:MAG TPA: UDP-N-acetylglucosamine 2-epimerase (non-hydrolyzing) [Gemmatimonadaceae bacterium]|nr:UDP-N-acetylglucosamine 2-epimerase (non-hydrolyzing) [Gemmatimonadaceae bacterium]